MTALKNVSLCFNFEILMQSTEYDKRILFNEYNLQNQQVLRLNF